MMISSNRLNEHAFLRVFQLVSSQSVVAIAAVVFSVETTYCK